jgi:hypothetical protein
MIVDRDELHVYGFNYTARDLKSRSFGVITRDRRTVLEALRLFEADAQRVSSTRAVRLGSSSRIQRSSGRCSRSSRQTGPRPIWVRRKGSRLTRPRVRIRDL